MVCYTVKVCESLVDRGGSVTYSGSKVYVGSGCQRLLAPVLLTIPYQPVFGSALCNLLVELFCQDIADDDVFRAEQDHVDEERDSIERSDTGNELCAIK